MMPPVNQEKIFADDEIQAFHGSGTAGRNRDRLCMVYVDFDPIRAEIEKTPEGSEFKGVKERVAVRWSASDLRTADAQDVRIEHGEHASWLAPVPCLRLNC